MFSSFEVQFDDHINLVYADRNSGMLWCDRLNNMHTKNIIKMLMKWMLDFGCPRSMRIDGGPQYCTEFKEWCKEKGIEHSVTSPYNPQSNCHAEGTVKQAKFLLKKCQWNMDTFHFALSEWRNAPHADGVSPSDLLFCWRLRSSTPPALCKNLSLIHI